MCNAHAPDFNTKRINFDDISKGKNIIKEKM